MKKLVKFIVGTAVLIAPLAAFGQSQSFSLWFASPTDSSGTPITSLNIGGVGSTVDLSVWFESSIDLTAAEVLVAYDHSLTEGIGAVPTDGMLQMANGDQVTNLNPGYSLIASPLSIGAYSTTDGSRPYGLDVPLGYGSLGSHGTQAATHLFDISLKNVGITAGNSYTMSIYDNGASSYDTTNVQGYDGNTYHFGGASLTLNVQAAPEPFSLAALGIGVAGLIRRKRS